MQLTGLEPLVVAYFIDWTRQRANAAGTQIDGQFGQALKALVDRLLAKLGADSAVRQLERDARDAVENPVTVQQAERAVQEAVRTDPVFGSELAELVRQAHQLSTTSTQGSVVINASAHERAQMPIAGGNQTIYFGTHPE